jgi:RNA polymerase sigma factor (sigma-70 family)
MEDLFQEVWQEVIVQLPRLVYDPSRGSFSAWLAGLVEKKIRRLMAKRVLPWREHSLTIDMLENRLSSSELGPEDDYRLQEMRERLNDALVEFRHKVPPENCDLFCWRFFQGRSFKEIAAMSGLSAKAVRRRCDRMKVVWHGLTKDLPLSGSREELSILPQPTIQVRPQAG